MKTYLLPKFITKLQKLVDLNTKTCYISVEDFSIRSENENLNCFSFSNLYIFVDGLNLDSIFKIENGEIYFLYKATDKYICCDYVKEEEKKEFYMNYDVINIIKVTKNFNLFSF